MLHFNVTDYKLYQWFGCGIIEHTKLFVKGQIMRKIFISLVCCVGLGITFSAFAETDAERGAKELAKYNQTGEFKKCINFSLIKNTKVIDDNRIVFEMKHRKYMLNTLKSECRKLAYNNNFAIAPMSNRVCGSDMINVVSSLSGGAGGAACLLGEFEVLEKRPRS